jgi:hypothetical protein
MRAATPRVRVALLLVLAALPPGLAGCAGWLGGGPAACSSSELSPSDRLAADFDLYATTVNALALLRTAKLIDDDAALVIDDARVEIRRNLSKRKAALADPAAPPAADAYAGLVSAFDAAIYRLLDIKAQAGKRAAAGPPATRPAR